MRFLYDTTTAEEAAQRDEHTNAKEDIQRNVVVIIGLGHRQHERGIGKHPHRDDHNDKSNNLQTSKRLVMKIKAKKAEIFIVRIIFAKK